MTKRNLYLFIGLICLIATLVIFYLKSKPQPEPKALETSLTRPTPESPSINNKKVVGLPPGNTADQLAKIKITNTATPHWKPNLERALRSQGGDEVKSIDIRKVDSFIWNQDGLALHVESVVVTLKNQKNESTTFKALVDSQTGKILKNWDQPIFDSIHPKDNYKVRIDPRYHNQ